MDEVRQYIVSIITAAIICGTVTCLVGKKGNIASIVKFLCGLFMTITAIAPWVNLRLPDDYSFWDTLQAEAQISVAEGEEISAQMQSAIIKEQLESYVLEKANSLELDVSVEISLNDRNLPDLVIIQGAASPYARNRLSSYICENLGVTEDGLKWT